MSGSAGVLLARPLAIHQGLHYGGLIICSTVTPFELARDPLLGTITSQILAAAEDLESWPQPSFPRSGFLERKRATAKLP